MLQQIVSEPNDTGLPCNHDGAPGGPPSVDFVQGQEGRSSSVVVLQPADGLGCDLIGFNDHRHHPTADGGGQGRRVGFILRCTEFSDGPENALQFSGITGSEDSRGASSQARGARIRLHGRTGARQLAFHVPQARFNRVGFLHQRGFLSLSGGQVTSEAFPVGSFGHGFDFLTLKFALSDLHLGACQGFLGFLALLQKQLTCGG